MVHVSRLEVVCFPAKKNVLHSSTMSRTVIVDVRGAAMVPALIMTSNRSFGLPPSGFSSSARSFRRPISLIKLLLISFSSLHELVFLFVGKNL